MMNGQDLPILNQSSMHLQQQPPPTITTRMRGRGGALLWRALAVAFVVQLALALNDYHNVFCGKANCYELLNVAEVSHTR